MIDVQVSSEWDRWVAGFASLPGELLQQGRVFWGAALGAFYDTSQDLAHIDTGEMKGSGHYQMTASGTELVAELVYDSDHALFEEARGGDHAFISRSWELSEPAFAEALPATFELVIKSWR